MIRFLFKILFLSSLVSPICLSAQTAFRWIPREVSDCFFGTITSINDLNIQGPCTEVELLSDRETIRITASEAFGNALSLLAYIPTQNGRNWLPGDIGQSGSIDWSIEGDLDYIDLESSYFVFVYDKSGDIEQSIRISLKEMVGDTSECLSLIPGGTKISVSSMYFKYSENFIDGTPIELKLSYDFVPLAISTISEIEIADASFDGSTYNYELPSGEITFASPTEGVPVEIETNTSEAQIINLSKNGGKISLSSNTKFDIQKATSSQKRHFMNFSLQEVDMCLSDYEFIIDSSSTLLLNNSNINYDDVRSCILIGSDATLVVPENGYQKIGNSGVGMHAWLRGALTKVMDNATLVLDNLFTFKDSTFATIDVYPGGHLEVTASTSIYIYSESRGVGYLTVNLYDDATFNMSAAPLEVQEVFVVNLVSTNQDILPLKDYTIYPNPTIADYTSVKLSSVAKSLASVEVVDISGRVVANYVKLQESSDYSIQLPSKGVYILRLTDIEGRVGHKRVIRQ